MRFDNWKEYISFEFIYILNIIKSKNFKDFKYLVTQSNLGGIVQLIVLKDEKYLEHISKESIYLLKNLDSSKNILNELYLEIYKNYNIHEYNISPKKYLEIQKDTSIIETKLEELHYDDNKTYFLKNLVLYIYADKEKQREVLDKTIKVLINYKKVIDYEGIIEIIIARNNNIATLVNNDNLEVFLKLKEEDELFTEFIFKLIMLFNSIFLNKFFDRNTFKILLEEYFKHLLKFDEKTVYKKLTKDIGINTLFDIQSKKNQELISSIRVTILKTFKNPLINKMIVESLGYENIKWK